jgi:predicted nucleic acid-binding protein
VVAVDSSVAIAAFATWHEMHEPAHELVRTQPSIPSHALLETYSVLTRLPAPFRAAADVVGAFLEQSFSSDVRLTLDTKAQASLVDSLLDLGVTGGAVYDGLNALTTKAGNGELMTLDRRALTTYRRCGVPARLVS